MIGSHDNCGATGDGLLGSVRARPDRWGDPRGRGRCFQKLPECRRRELGKAPEAPQRTGWKYCMTRDATCEQDKLPEEPRQGELCHWDREALPERSTKARSGPEGESLARPLGGLRGCHERGGRSVVSKRVCHRREYPARGERQPRNEAVGRVLLETGLAAQYTASSSDWFGIDTDTASSANKPTRSTKLSRPDSCNVRRFLPQPSRLPGQGTHHKPKVASGAGVAPCLIHDR